MSSRDILSLADVSGQLCIKDSTTLSTEPLRITHYWPTGIKTYEFIRSYWPLEEIDVHESWSHNGTYRINHKGSYSHQDLYLPLINGNSTKSIKMDKEEIPCPKVREGIQTRYFFGTWQKYLKSKGWVPA